MFPGKMFAMLLASSLVMTAGGCAGTRTRETTGQYVDDSVITNKIRAAILGEPGLKSTEIGIETFKGRVQLSGFVSQRSDIDSAIRLARNVDGVSSVTNDLQLK
jgi:osmotically-inducible protein OsmY